ncbi:MAG: ribbon-helix-helix protein, CopG family [Firmicutes bacterium]|nr:ribbon-helix-helix protein, CopG family [Bacillota bacterium]
MPKTKRIMISLPGNLLSEVDGVVASEKKTRSEFIREAMKLYLQERKKRQIREKMQRGYREMAKINLDLSREALHVENEAVLIAEELVGGE